MVKIGEQAPDFIAKAYHEDKILNFKLSDLKGKWVILFFYPGDFTFVCPTELGELSKEYLGLKKKGTELLGISTDSVYVHKAWHDTSDTIKKVEFPLVSDQNGNIAKLYGTYLEDQGVSLRGTFLIDPKGVIKSIEIHHNTLGRNIQETLRKLDAAQYIQKNGEQACPANWKPGERTLKPGLELVGKL